MGWRLDRLGRSLPRLIEVVESLGERGIDFRSLTEAIDTTTPTGRLLFHVAGRSRNSNATCSGSARRPASRLPARGHVGGRPSVMAPERVRQAQRRGHRPGRAILAASGQGPSRSG
jgi:DNA invertase Pin-like site-specific DNA recombinase